MGLKSRVGSSFVRRRWHQCPSLVVFPAHRVAAMTDGALKFVTDFAIGGISGAVAKTCTAPIERVKLLIQTQDANPKIMSGEVARYTGIVDCFSRVSKEQGIQAFWRGNFTNIIRY